MGLSSGSLKIGNKIENLAMVGINWRYLGAWIVRLSFLHPIGFHLVGSALLPGYDRRFYSDVKTI
jgi:hypothetical protein